MGSGLTPARFPDPSSSAIMIKPQRFRKLPECETCLFYTDDMMQMCRLHPRGVTTEQCLDYREDPSAERNWAEFLGFAQEHQAFSEEATGDQDP